MFFPVFIRSYGMHLKVTPNMAEALEPLLITELGKLKKPITNLYSRLVNGSDPQVSWRLFAAETRSELAKRAVKIFIDTVENGGDPAITGASLSDHYNELARLRRRKFQIGKTFETTTYLIHSAATLIVVFIVLLIQKFSLVLSTVQAMMPAQIGIFIIYPWDNRSKHLGLIAFPIYTCSYKRILHKKSCSFKQKGSLLLLRCFANNN
jgi:flagellar protein FlaJ